MQRLIWKLDRATFAAEGIGMAQTANSLREFRIRFEEFNRRKDKNGLAAQMMSEQLVGVKKTYHTEVSGVLELVQCLPADEIQRNSIAVAVQRNHISLVRIPDGYYFRATNPVLSFTMLTATVSLTTLGLLSLLPSMTQEKLIYGAFILGLFNVMAAGFAHLNKVIGHAFYSPEKMMEKLTRMTQRVAEAIEEVEKSLRPENQL